MHMNVHAHMHARARAHTHTKKFSKNMQPQEAIPSSVYAHKKVTKSKEKQRKLT
jgi:hypothetical protein